jgi:hypothetical protein
MQGGLWRGKSRATTARPARRQSTSPPRPGQALAPDSGPPSATPRQTTPKPNAPAHIGPMGSVGSFTLARSPTVIGFGRRFWTSRRSTRSDDPGDVPSPTNPPSPPPRSVSNHRFRNASDRWVRSAETSIAPPRPKLGSVGAILSPRGAIRIPSSGRCRSLGSFGARPDTPRIESPPQASVGFGRRKWPWC